MLQLRINRQEDFEIIEFAQGRMVTVTSFNDGEVVRTNFWGRRKAISLAVIDPVPEALPLLAFCLPPA